MGMSLVITGVDFTNVRVGKVEITEPSDTPSVETTTVTLQPVATYANKLISAEGTYKASSVTTYKIYRYDISSVSANAISYRVDARSGTGVGIPCVSFMDANDNVLGIALIGQGEVTEFINSKITPPTGTKYVNVSSNTRYIDIALRVDVPST